MTPIAQDQLAYFKSRMPTKLELRAWRHHYRHRAEILEKEWPTEYEGLTKALEEWVVEQSKKRSPSGPE